MGALKLKPKVRKNVCRIKEDLSSQGTQSKQRADDLMGRRGAPLISLSSLCSSSHCITSLFPTEWLKALSQTPQNETSIWTAFTPKLSEVVPILDPSPTACKVSESNRASQLPVLSPSTLTYLFWLWAWWERGRDRSTTKLPL